MIYDENWSEWLPNVVVIERPDGSTYEQPYNDFMDLIETKDLLGQGYLIVAIY